MLDFIESLKQIISNVQSTGGAVIERNTPSADLLQRLREYALGRLAETSTKGWILEEWFTEGLFNEYVRVSVIHLSKIGIVDNDFIYRVLVKVIDSIIPSDKQSRDRGSKDFEEQIANSLIMIWDFMGDDQTRNYTFAQERWLISWDYQQSCWKPTSLGKFLLELSPVQAATFLLSIDTLFSKGVRDFRHISPKVLKGLLSPRINANEDVRPDLIPIHRDILYRIGILTELNEYDDSFELTPAGKIVVRRVLDKDNPLRDVASDLIETEELGELFRGSASEIDQVLQLVKQNSLVDKANRESINTSVQLYQSRKYLESLRILYPSIESIINNMLVKVGERPENFAGLAQKTRYLEQQGIIPPDVSSAVEVFTGRNRVLHGNFSPPEDYVFPLCLLAFRYLRRLLTEYKLTK